MAPPPRVEVSACPWAEKLIAATLRQAGPITRRASLASTPDLGSSYDLQACLRPACSPTWASAQSPLPPRTSLHRQSRLRSRRFKTRKYRPGFARPGSPRSKIPVPGPHWPGIPFFPGTTTSTGHGGPSPAQPPPDVVCYAGPQAVRARGVVVGGGVGGWGGWGGVVCGGVGWGWGLFGGARPIPGAGRARLSH